ncbi:MAG: sigma-70 family RNA polymerase sigma factor [Acidimicrobiia bacterium]
MEPATGASGDGELVTRARRGDLGAFEELVRRHEATAIRVASVVCGSAGAEDAVQEGFIRAFRSLGRFDAARPFLPWLLRIVVNGAKNRVRAEQRHLQLTLRARAADTADDAGPAAVMAEERRLALAQAVARLPARDRVMIACRWFEDMSEREIAATLAIRPGTVKSRLSRAMARLRAELEELEVARD